MAYRDYSFRCGPWPWNAFPFVVEVCLWPAHMHVPTARALRGAPVVDAYLRACVRRDAFFVSTKRI